MTWGDLVTRARGLATHLAGEAQLEEIERARDGAGLARALAQAGITAVPLADPSPAAIEAAADARRAGDLAVLERWAADRGPALAVITDQVEVERLRALIRSPAGGPALADRLARHRHPAAEALVPLLKSTPVDLVAVEQTLIRGFTARARAGAAADHALAVHLAQVIDVANAEAALLLAARGGTLDRAAAFIEGGKRLSRAAFAAAAAAPPVECAAALAHAFSGTPLAEAVTATAPGAVEHAALVWHLATQRRLRRQEPLGLAAVIWLVLARRLEARRLRAAAWHLALRGAP